MSDLKCMYCAESGITNTDVFIEIVDVELGHGWICKECFIESEKEKDEHLKELEEQLKAKEQRIVELNKTIQAKEQECERLKEELAELISQSALLPKFFGLSAEEITQLATKCSKLSKTLTEIKEIAEPYRRDIDKICGYCRKYDSCHACCIDDLKLYEYRTGTTKACERFVELGRFDINIVANRILQKISECEVE